MIASRPLRPMVLVLALLSPQVADAQKDPVVPKGHQRAIPLYAYLPSAADLGNEDAPVAQGRGTGWGGDEGYQREFGGEFGAATVQLGTSEFLSVTTLVERFAQRAQPRMVLTVLTGMDRRALGELFAQGAVAEMGEGILDSLTVTPLDDPGLGEASAAFLIAWRASFMQFDMLLILVSRGDLLEVVMAMSAPGAGSVSDLLPLAALIDGRITDPSTIPETAVAAATVEAVPPDLDVEPDQPALAWSEDDVRNALVSAGVDLDAILLSEVDLPDGAAMSDEELHPLLGGLGRVSRDFEASWMFRYGNSEIAMVYSEVSAHRDAGAAVFQQMVLARQLRDTTLVREMLGAAAEEYLEAEWSMVALDEPAVGDRASAALISVVHPVLRFDAAVVFFVRGAFQVGLMGGGPGGRVDAEDVVALASVLDGRMTASLPGGLLDAPSADRALALERLADGAERARIGDLEAALDHYRAAFELDASLAELPTAWYELCRWGALWDEGDTVLDACDRTVELADGNREVHEARGIARAVAGDLAGAAEDLEVSLTWTASSGDRAKRREWIAALQRAENPFTNELLEELRGEAVEW